MRRFRDLFSPVLTPNKYHVWFLGIVFAVSFVVGVYAEYLSKKHSEASLEYLWEFERIATFQVFEAHTAALELMKILPYGVEGKTLPDIRRDVAGFAHPMTAYLENIVTSGRLPERVLTYGDPLLVKDRYRALLDEIEGYIGRLKAHLAGLQAAPDIPAAAVIIEDVKRDVGDFRQILGRFNGIFTQIFSTHYTILRRDVEERQWYFDTIRLLSLALVFGTAVVAGIMFWGLRRSQAALRQARDGLEATVRERTEELSQINQMLRDEIQERIQAEETLRSNEKRLRQVQKMEAVGQLTGGISHDFNNLLQVILTSLEVIDIRAGEDQGLQPYIEKAILASRRGAGLTQQLLAFSRRQALSPQTVKPVELVAGMLEIVARTLGEDIVIETSAEDGIPEISIDPVGLESAILNIALNARAAMPGGGKLTVSIRMREAEGRPRKLSPGLPETSLDFVEITLTDTGGGMSEETRNHAFEPFFTTKEVGEGSGLGLSMVYGFVKQSEGFVAIDSEEGCGTSVSLWLPVSGQLPAGKAEEQPAIVPRADAGVVLVVEDDRHVRQSTVLLLSFLGHRVREAEDGPTALRLLDEGERVDLLFSDVVMPKGMSGFDLARAAQERRPGLKVLLTSGYPESELAKNGMSSGDYVLLRKPFSKAELINALAKIFGADGEKRVET